MGCHKGVQMNRYTDEERQFLIDHVEGITSAECAEMFNKTFKTVITGVRVNSFRKRYGLKSGVVTRFQKGHVPANKGIKGVSHPGMEKTQFKKGNIPPNLKPQWSERITRDGFVEIKTEPHQKKWKLKSRWVWEQYYGPIPRNMRVFHINGISTDDRIENLRLVSNQDLLNINRDGLMTDDPDINEVVLNIAKVKTALNGRAKKNGKTTNVRRRISNDD